MCLSGGFGRKSRKGGSSSRGSSKGLFSVFASHIRAIRGLRYAARLLTGKAGFSLRGPAGMKLHYNADGSLRSMSLKSCAGMRLVLNSNGKFKGLSIPGPLKGTRIFTNARGEFTGFGLSRLFGGFLLYDAHGNLKRAYGPVSHGSCVSVDADGNKKSHEVNKKDKNAFLEKEVKSVIPDTHKIYSKKGEVTEKGIVPIRDEELKQFNVKEKKKASPVKAREAQVKRTEIDRAANVKASTEPKQMNLSDVKLEDSREVKTELVKSVTGESETSTHIERETTNEPTVSLNKAEKVEERVHEVKVDSKTLAREMDETYKVIDEVAEGREEVSFDELFGK